MTGPRIGELFAGYGGLGMGVQAAFGGEVAWYSEIDKGALKILQHRFPDVPNVGDVTTVDWSQVEPVDILTGGFPCQDVSAAGKRAGLKEGTRSGLWHQMVRAIDALRPPLVVIENVRGLLSARGDTSDEFERAELRCQLATNLREWIDERRYRAINEGRTEDAERLKRRTDRLVGLHRRAVAARRRAERRIIRAIGTVLGTLADLGYDASWHGIRAADVGAPHGRFRVFVVATDAQHSQLERVGQLSGLRGGHDSRADMRMSGVRPDLTLLPTPAVNDMGAAYTPETWDAWTADMQAKHGNGNGHGKSLAIEAQRLLPTPQASEAAKAVSGQSVAHRESGGHQVWLTNVAHDLALLPTPKAIDGDHPGIITTKPGQSTHLSAEVYNNWGDYAAAIARWEHALGRPAPAPTMTSTKGNPQLSPAFVEWMMGLPAGWVTDVPGITRNEALKALGNGVVPQQCAAALRTMLAWEMVA